MRILSWSAKPTMEWTSKTELPLVHTIHTESKVRLSHYDGRYFVKICGSNFHHLPSTSINFRQLPTFQVQLSNCVQPCPTHSQGDILHRLRQSCDVGALDHHLTAWSRCSHHVHLMFTRNSLPLRPVRCLFWLIWVGYVTL